MPTPRKPKREREDSLVASAHERGLLPQGAFPCKDISPSSLLFPGNCTRPSVCPCVHRENGGGEQCSAGGGRHCPGSSREHPCLQNGEGKKWTCSKTDTRKRKKTQNAVRFMQELPASGAGVEERRGEERRRMERNEESRAEMNEIMRRKVWSLRGGCAGACLPAPLEAWRERKMDPSKECCQTRACALAWSRRGRATLPAERSHALPRVPTCDPRAYSNSAEDSFTFS